MRSRKKIICVLLSLLLLIGAFAPCAQADAAVYRIRVNKQCNTVTVYKKKGQRFKPYKAFVCSVGKSTPIGKFRIYQKLRWHALVDSTYGQYCTRFVGSFLFHSVWYYRPNPASLANKEYNKLGTTASHGCVRLCVRDAKWIYDNCSAGTVVEVYRSADPGPLGKPEAIRLPSGRGYDPTDVWSFGNPYNKKKPKITGARNKTIPYGTSGYSPMTGVRAKNTTGFNAKKRLSITIRYKQDSGSRYKKVKMVDTKKPGKYRITYRCVDEIGRKATVTVIHRVLPAPKTPTPVPTSPPVVPETLPSEMSTNK